jgi:hypothetical protein
MRAVVERERIPHERSPKTGCVTISLGVAVLTPRRGADRSQLVTLADRMLYQAKAAGRNRVCAPDPIPGGFFRSEAMDRRGFARQDAVPNRAILGPAGRSLGRRMQAKLVNISQGGALLSTAGSWPLNEPIRMRMKRPVKTDWTAALPVRLGRPCEVAVRFQPHCPDDLLRAATLGLDRGPMIGAGDRPGSEPTEES